jgi:hypothetical protein
MSTTKKLQLNERTTREDDSWLTAEELKRCERADESDAFQGPVPTRHISNGEYMPIPQSPQQQEVEARLREIAGTAAKKLGIGRRYFLRGAGGLAASFIAMNAVHGKFFDVEEEELYERGKDLTTKNGIPKDVFVVDDQLHIVRGTRSGGGFTLRALAQGPTAMDSGIEENPFNPEGLPDEFGDPWGVWNPELVGRPITETEFQLIEWVKNIYLRSHVHVGLLSNVTAFNVVAPTGEERGGLNPEEAREFEILTAEQTAAVRDFVNALAGSKRCMAHGLFYTGSGNVDYLQEQTDKYQPDSWKGYNISRAAKVDDGPMVQWALDEEDVAYPSAACDPASTASASTRASCPPTRLPTPGSDTRATSRKRPTIGPGSISSSITPASSRRSSTMRRSKKFAAAICARAFRTSRGRPSSRSSQRDGTTSMPSSARRGPRRSSRSRRLPPTSSANCFSTWAPTTFFSARTRPGTARRNGRSTPSGASRSRRSCGRSTATRG